VIFEENQYLLENYLSDY